MVNAMGQEKYGAIHAHLFDTMEEALAYARSHIQQEAQSKEFICYLSESVG